MVAARDFAVAISGEETPPDWLLRAVPTLADIVRGNIAAEAVALSKPDLRRQLAATADAASLILTQLGCEPGADSIHDMLLSGDERNLPHLNELYHGLTFLVGRCAEKLASVPAGSGRAVVRAEVDNTPSARAMCALIVAVSWRHARGADVPHTSRSAQAACANLWAVAGGATSGGGWGTTAGGWRHHLAAVKADWLRSYQAGVLHRVLGQPAD